MKIYHGNTMVIPQCTMVIPWYGYFYHGFTVVLLWYHQGMGIFTMVLPWYEILVPWFYHSILWYTEVFIRSTPWYYLQYTSYGNLGTMVLRRKRFIPW